MGLLSFAQFHVVPLTIFPGDRIVLLSDGVTEAEDPTGTEFGQNDLGRYLALADPIPALFTALERFCKGVRAADDQTVLTIDRFA